MKACRLPKRLMGQVHCDAAEAHKMSRNVSKFIFILDEQTQLLINILNNKMFQTEGLCQLFTRNS